MPKSYPKSWTLLLILGCASCGQRDDGAASGPPWVVRDSAGITIIENDRPAPESRLAWEIGTQPSLSIGAVDSGDADQLFQVTDAARFPDGRIVIANSGSNELRVFNADGSHAATWGRRGEGPGEFTGSSPTLVAPWPGDSVAAANPWGTRLSLFDADGNHGRDLSLDTRLLNVVDLLSDGKILSSGSGGLDAGMTGTSGLIRSDTEWGILAADGTLHASLGEYPGGEWWAVFGADGTIEGGRPHPFGRLTVGAVWGDLVTIGVQDSYEIKAFGTDDGSLVRIVRRDGDPGSPTQADLDAYYARRFANIPDDDRTNALNAVRDMPLVESYPAFMGIISDLAGHLWVREYLGSAEGGLVWTVFDPEGRVQGLIETPPGLRVFEIGADYILGWVYDDLGVEYVQLWPLSRGADSR